MKMVTILELRITVRGKRKSEHNSVPGKRIRIIQDHSGVVHSARRARVVTQVVVLAGHLHVVVGDMVGREKRGLSFNFRRPPLVCAMWAFSCCMVTAKGWHCPTSSRMQLVRFLRHVVGDGHVQPRSTAYFAPRCARLCGIQFNIRADSCQQPQKKTQECNGKSKN